MTTGLISRILTGIFGRQKTSGDPETIYACRACDHKTDNFYHAQHHATVTGHGFTPGQ